MLLASVLAALAFLTGGSEPGLGCAERVPRRYPARRNASKAP